jgi:RloB-like protein
MIMARDSRSLSRRPGTSAEAETIAVVCEGEKTEDIYFNGIRKEHRLATTRLPVVGPGVGPSVGLGADPLKVVEQAESLRQEYDHAWAVFDVEAPGPHAAPHPRLKQAIERAERVGVRCAISHPCFELWLLLHFQLQTAYLNNEAVRSKVRRCDCGYSERGFDFARIWPHRQNAIRNANELDARQRSNISEIVDRNPWTTVHELVLQLLTLVRPPH